MYNQSFESDVLKYVESFNLKIDYIISYSISKEISRFCDVQTRGKNIHLTINFNIAYKDDYYFYNYKAIIAQKIASIYLDELYVNGDRIFLKRFELSDLNDYYDIACNKNVAIPDGIKPVKNVDQARKNLYNLMHKRFGYGIYLKDTKKLIGTISAVSSDRECLSTEIGYSLNEAYWHKGYASEALEILLNVLFNILDYDMVEAYTFLDNKNSIKLLNKFNFVKEGVIRKKIFRFQIGTTDVYSFSLTKDDYHK